MSDGATTIPARKGKAARLSAGIGPREPQTTTSSSHAPETPTSSLKKKEIASHAPA